MIVKKSPPEIDKMALAGDILVRTMDLLAGKVTLVAGHSGVGKSTLINAIDPSLDLWTLEISESSGKGQHTTTNAEMQNLEWSSTPVTIFASPPSTRRTPPTMSICHRSIDLARSHRR